MTAVLVVLFVLVAALAAIGVKVAVDTWRIQRRVDEYLARRESGFGRTPVGRTIHDRPRKP